MSKYVQLLSKQMIGREWYEAGDWVKVGTQTAEKLVAARQARYAREVPLVKVELPKVSAPARVTDRTAQMAERIKSVSPVSLPVARRTTFPSASPTSKVAFGMIVFNGDHVLEGVLSTIYPWASQICIAEGPVKFHADRLGTNVSTDNTVEIIKNFPDPDRKISLVQGVWPEKTEMCNAWIENVEPDTDYVWQIDSDEMYTQEAIKNVFAMLGPDGYDSIAFRFRSFYGGFDRHMIGWEEAQETHRIQRFYPGARWSTHRPPTILAHDGKPWREHNHISHWESDYALNARIFHYSFVFPGQTEMKYHYYNDLTKGAVIPNGFERLYLPWVQGDDKVKAEIEREFQGVHHLRRGPNGQCVCHTAKWNGRHPQWIEDHKAELEARIQRELEQWQ